MATTQRTIGPGLFNEHKAVICQIKVQGGINSNLIEKGVPLIPFSNTKLQISDLRATARTLCIVCIVQHFEVVLCCKEHHCICFRQYKARLTPAHHIVML